jgi:hypothetical protein
MGHGSVARAVLAERVSERAVCPSPDQGHGSGPFSEAGPALFPDGDWPWPVDRGSSPYGSHPARVLGEDSSPALPHVADTRERQMAHTLLQPRELFHRRPLCLAWAIWAPAAYSSTHAEQYSQKASEWVREVFTNVLAAKHLHRQLVPMAAWQNGEQSSISSSLMEEMG